MTRFLFAFLGLALIAQGGCASVVPPAPAVVTLAARGCAAEADLAAAAGLVPETERAVYVVTTPIGSATPCLRRDGVDTSYVLHALPSDSEDKTITVGGYLEPLRILSPAVALLDAEGKETRRFRAEDFLYRGPNYSVLFRPRDGERYLLVTVDPSRVGQAYDSIAIGRSATTSYTPYGPVTFTVGTDASHVRTFSYEGAVQVVVNDRDTKETPASP